VTLSHASVLGDDLFNLALTSKIFAGILEEKHEKRSHFDFFSILESTQGGGGTNSDDDNVPLLVQGTGCSIPTLMVPPRLLWGLLC